MTKSVSNFFFEYKINLGPSSVSALIIIPYHITSFSYDNQSLRRLRDPSQLCFKTNSNLYCK